MPGLHYSNFGKIAAKLRQWASEWLVMGCNWYLETAESYFLTRAEKKPGRPLMLYKCLYEAKFAYIQTTNWLFSPKKLIGIWRRNIITVCFILWYFFQMTTFLKSTQPGPTWWGSRRKSRGGLHLGWGRKLTVTSNVTCSLLQSKEKTN